MKKTRIIFISILTGIVVLFLVVLLLAVTTESRVKNKAVRQGSKEASETNKKKDFKNIDVDKYLELYKQNKVSIVLIGRSGCE